MNDEAIQEAKIVKVYGKSIWVESDLLGAKHVMVKHEDCEPFEYCSFHYDYSHTDNATTRRLAEKIALMLGATDPVEHKHRIKPLIMRENSK